MNLVNRQRMLLPPSFHSLRRPTIADFHLTDHISKSMATIPVPCFSITDQTTLLAKCLRTLSFKAFHSWLMSLILRPWNTTKIMAAIDFEVEVNLHISLFQKPNGFRKCQASEHLQKASINRHVWDYNFYKLLWWGHESLWWAMGLEDSAMSLMMGLWTLMVRLWDFKIEPCPCGSIMGHEYQWRLWGIHGPYNFFFFFLNFEVDLVLLPV